MAPVRYPRLNLPQKVEKGDPLGDALGEGPSMEETEAMLAEEEQEAGEREQHEAPPPPISTPHTPPLPTSQLAPPGSKPVPTEPLPALLDPPSPKQVGKDISVYLARCQHMALQRIEQLIQRLDLLPIDVLVDVVQKLADMRLTEEWTKRLVDQIEKNPNNLTPTGVRAPLLNKLKGMAAKTRLAARQDGRTSGAKLQQHLPQD